MDSEKHCIRVKIIGKVQGVWFRAHTQEKASELGITGWVKNEPDGSVLAEASGTPTSLDQFVEWCHHGSPLSRVEDVIVKKIECPDYQGFNIRR